MAPEERVDIEALMAEIRRKAEEELLENSSEQSRRQRLRFILENSRLQIERTIAPGRSLGDRMRSSLRRFIYRETVQTAEPLMDKQSAWNRAVAALLQEQAAEIERLRRLVTEAEVMPPHDFTAEEDAPEQSAPAEE